MDVPKAWEACEALNAWHSYLHLVRSIDSMGFPDGVLRDYDSGVPAEYWCIHAEQREITCMLRVENEREPSNRLGARRRTALLPRTNNKVAIAGTFASITIDVKGYRYKFVSYKYTRRH